MTKRNDLGLPSANKVSTQQQDRENEITHLKKEISLLKYKMDKYLDESLYFKARCIELNDEIERLTTKDSDVSYLRKAV